MASPANHAGHRSRGEPTVRNSAAALATVSISISLLAFPAAAQSTQPTSTPPTDQAATSSVETLHVTSREVGLTVLVTDANGNPVHGLQRSDFTVSENGKQQLIRGFQEFDQSKPFHEPPAVILPRGVYTNSQIVPRTGPVNIFLLEVMNHRIGADAQGPRADPMNVIRARQQIVEYIRKMPPNTRVAIFWLTETGVHLAQGFTSNSELLIHALNTPQLDIGSSGVPLAQQMTTASSLNQIASYVSGIKGRKNLFWFYSGAPPVALTRDGGYSWANLENLTTLSIGAKTFSIRSSTPYSDDQSDDTSMVHNLMDTYELLTAAQVSVYPVSVDGVTSLGLPQLEMEKIAKDFGGTPIYNTNDLATPVAKAIDYASQGYTISYAPSHQREDGRFHTIKVEVDRPSLQLKYRSGYNAERVPTPAEPAPGPALMKASMEGKAPPATQILFDAGVWPDSSAANSAPTSSPEPEPAKKASSKLVPYVIQYGFPSTQIMFAEGMDGRLHADLEFDIAAYDYLSRRVALLTQTVAIPMGVDWYDDFASKPFRFTQHVDLPPGAISLRLGIYDTVSHKVGTLEIPIVVAKTKKEPRQPKKR